MMTLMPPPKAIQIVSRLALIESPLLHGNSNILTKEEQQRQKKIFTMIS